MNWVEIVSAVLGLSCVFLAGRNSKYNFWIGYTYNVFLFVLFLSHHLYSAMMLQPISFAINLYGHWRWTHPAENERSSQDASRLKVSSLNWKQLISIIGIVAVAGAAWALCLQWLPMKWPSVFQPDPNPWLDSYVLALTLSAQFLSAQKRWECWIVWLLVNITNMALYISAGLYLMPIVSGLYLINGIISLIHWMKLYRKNA